MLKWSAFFALFTFLAPPPIPIANRLDFAKATIAYSTPSDFNRMQFAFVYAFRSTKSIDGNSMAI